MLLLLEQVSPAAVNFSGNASGVITFTITSPPQLGASSSAPQTSKVTVPLKVLIQPTPPRSKRLIWDVLHSIKYPPGYVPRDNLDVKVCCLPGWCLGTGDCESQDQVFLAIW
jgi:membrane-bound transcription factor site-1 protease